MRDSHITPSAAAAIAAIQHKVPEPLMRMAAQIEPALHADIFQHLLKQSDMNLQQNEMLAEAIDVINAMAHEIKTQTTLTNGRVLKAEASIKVLNAESEQQKEATKKWRMYSTRFMTIMIPTITLAGYSLISEIGVGNFFTSLGKAIWKALGASLAVSLSLSSCTVLEYNDPSGARYKRVSVLNNKAIGTLQLTDGNRTLVMNGYLDDTASAAADIAKELAPLITKAIIP